MTLSFKKRMYFLALFLIIFCSSLALVLATTYTFSGISNPSTTHTGWDSTDTALPPASSTLTSETEVSTNAYTNVTSSDDSRADYYTSTANNYAAQKFVFVLSEAAASIATLNVSWEGYGCYGGGPESCDGGGGSNFYIWNFTANTWSLVGSNANAADAFITLLYDTNIADYVNSTKHLLLLAESTTKVNQFGKGPPYSTIFTDFVTAITTTSNTAPTISTSNISNYGATINPVEGSILSLPITFIVQDADGTDNIQNNTIIANFTAATGGPGSPNKNTNVSDCYSAAGKYTSINSTAANYTCIIEMGYWNISDTWTVTLEANDTSGSTARDSSQTFTYGSLVALTISPAIFGFSNVQVTGGNYTANTSIQINNTGNYQFANNTIRVKAYDLHGDVIESDHIGAENFTANTADVCRWTPADSNSTNLTNATNVNVSHSQMYKKDQGPASDIGPYENIYFCLNDMLDIILAQSYSTTYSSDAKWVIGA